MGVGSVLGRQKSAPRRGLRPVEAPTQPDPRSVHGRPGSATAGSLTQALERHLVEIEPSRVGGEAIHASSLYGLCTRQQALLEGKPAPAQVIKAGERVRFDLGNAVHDLVREKYLGPRGLLLGSWLCLRCRKAEWGKMPARCPSCRKDGPFKYQEDEVRNEQWRIVGHLDGVLPPEPGRRGAGVLEIKSAEGAVFDRLTRPMAEHLFRTSLYCWLSGRTWGRVFYVSTALQRGSITRAKPFKDFVVNFDVRVPQLVQRKLLELRAGGKRACASRLDPRAVRCPVRVPCWSTPT